MTKLKIISCVVIFLAWQTVVYSDIESKDGFIEDHSNVEDREHVNEWVVHIPKGKPK